MKKDAIDLSKLSDGTKVYLRMNSIDQILKDKGLDPGGDIQVFHTQNVLHRIIRYMPYRTGATIKVTIAQTDVRKPRIITDVPFAKFLYYGKLMVDPVTGAAGFQDKDGQWKSRNNVPKVKSNRPITYTTSKNPQAGPYWDRALVAAEGAKLTADLQRYINRKAGKQ